MWNPYSSSRWMSCPISLGIVPVSLFVLRLLQSGEQWLVIEMRELTILSNWWGGPSERESIRSICSDIILWWSIVPGKWFSSYLHCLWKFTDTHMDRKDTKSPISGGMHPLSSSSLQALIPNLSDTSCVQQKQWSLTMFWELGHDDRESALGDVLPTMAFHFPPRQKKLTSLSFSQKKRTSEFRLTDQGDFSPLLVSPLYFPLLKQMCTQIRRKKNQTPRSKRIAS